MLAVTSVCVLHAQCGRQQVVTTISIVCISPHSVHHRAQAGLTLADRRPREVQHSIEVYL